MRVDRTGQAHRLANHLVCGQKLWFGITELYASLGFIYSGVGISAYKLHQRKCFVLFAASLYQDDVLFSIPNDINTILGLG